MGAFVAPIIAGLSGLAGIFGSKKSTSQSTTTTTPDFTPQEQALINTLNTNYTNQINNAPAWNTAYVNSGLQNLVNSALQTSQAAQDATSARGIARTTAGANALTNTSYQQGQQLSNFLNQAPIVEQQNLNTNLNNAAAFEASLPVGTTSNSSGTAVNGPVNFVSGGISGAAQGLAAALGQQSATTQLGNILKGLGIQTGSTTTTPSTSTTPSTYTSLPNISTVPPGYSLSQISPSTQVSDDYSGLDENSPW